MSTIATLESPAVEALWNKVATPVESAATVQEAADQFLDRVHNELEEGLALARVFLTTPYKTLVDFRRRFVDDMASEAGVSSYICPDTPILSLLATRGIEAPWNDVKQSRGHIGIPLASEAFIGAIPMVARLLQEFEVGSALVRGEFSLRSEESAMRSFFVPDAATSRDEQNRNIIPMQNFVGKYDVHSVFGIGGPYWEDSQYVLVCIFFSTETLDRSVIGRLRPLFEHFKEATASLVQRSEIFE